MGPEERGDDVEKKVKYDVREKERLDVDRTWGAEFLIIHEQIQQSRQQKSLQRSVIALLRPDTQSCVNRWHLTQYDR